jgi:hypothetical protein
MEPSGSRWKPGQNPWLDARGLAQDKSLTLARLALLEERNGQADSAEQFWSKAETQMVLAKWKTPSRGKLRTFVERLDQSSYGPAVTPTQARAK